MRRVVVFDIDGTLTDTNAVDDECFLRAAGEVLGVELQATDWSEAPHVTDSALLDWLCERHCGRAVNAGEAASTQRLFVTLLAAELAANPQRFRPIPGARDVFPRLRAASWEVAVATGGWEPSARLKLRAIGLEHEPVPLASSSDVRTRTGIVALALERLGARPDRGVRAVSVGDGVWDVRAAAALDMPFVGIATGRHAEKLRRAGADTVLTDLRDTSALCAALDEATVPERR